MSDQIQNDDPVNDGQEIQLNRRESFSNELANDSQDELANRFQPQTIEEHSSDNLNQNNDYSGNESNMECMIDNTSF